MLRIDTSLFISKGELRSTYHHPDNNDLCVKINHFGDVGVSIKRQKREIKLYNKLLRNGVSFYNISQFKGRIKTNLGIGYCYEKITDYDRTISQDLKAVLTQREGDKDILKSIKELGDFLLENKIFFHDSFLGGSNFHVHP